jgi:hypothetical protein
MIKTPVIIVSGELLPMMIETLSNHKPFVVLLVKSLHDNWDSNRWILDHQLQHLMVVAPFTPMTIEEEEPLHVTWLMSKEFSGQGSEP